jgi:hypothetical protein
MSAAFIAAAVSGAYALAAVAIVHGAEAERLTPRWWRRLIAWLRHLAEAVHATALREVAAARTRWVLFLFSLHLLFATPGVHRR